MIILTMRPHKYALLCGLYRYPTHMSSTYGRDFARYYEGRYYEVSVYI